MAQAENVVDSNCKDIQEKVKIELSTNDEKCEDFPRDAIDGHVDDNKVNLTLLDLPPELILLIFSFIDARFTLTKLCRVCTFFNQLLSSEASWKTRFGKRWPRRDRKEDYDFIKSWKRICVEHEDMDRFWKDPENDFDFFQLKQHFAPVDSAIVMAGGRLCVSGSRDRSIGVWNLTGLKSEKDDGHDIVEHLSGHKGWVWCLASDPTGRSRFCSGSWDNSIKIWDLEGSNHNDGMTTIREHKAAVLCLDWKQDVLVSGCYDKYVRMFDLRDSCNVVSKLKYHTRPILCLSVDDKFVITGSEDQTVCIYDRRAAGIYKVLKLPGPAFSICRNSSSGYNYLRMGGRNGAIHLFDTTAGLFESLETPLNQDDSMELSGKICGLCQHGGAIVTASSDHTIQVLEPSRVQKKFYSFEKHTGDVASVFSDYGILASASSDLTVGIWMPKSMSPL